MDKILCAPNKLFSEAGVVEKNIGCSRCGIVVLLRASEQKVWSSKLYENAAGIRQEGHPEFKCYVTPVKSLVRKRVSSRRHSLNQHV